MGFPLLYSIGKNELEGLPIGLRRLAEIPSNVSSVTFNKRNSFLHERTISLVTAGSGYLVLVFVSFVAEGGGLQTFFSGFCWHVS